MAELRKDPITGEWVIIAPERATRPFDHDSYAASESPSQCPFCKGNEAETPDAVLTIPYDDSIDDWAVRIIPNRYPAVEGVVAIDSAQDDTPDCKRARGYHEVIVESPSHDLSMSDLSEEQFKYIVRAWRDRLAVVSTEETIRHTMIFKNEGAVAGGSLKHVHSQLLATSFIPPRIEAELTAGQMHFEENGQNLWTDMLNREFNDNSRIVEVNEQFVLFCPFASQFPGQMQIVPKELAPTFESTPDDELSSFAKILKDAVEALHNVFPEAPFNLGLHTAPPRDPRSSFYCWHLEVTPRLTGIAGFEIGSGSWINIVSPEDAAARYRETIESC